MKTLVFIAALLGTSCAAHVVVPPTPESKACQRECTLIQNTCFSAMGGVGISNAVACGTQYNDCMRSCPGAYEKK